MRDDIYTLPRVSFVAGQSITFRWNFCDSSGEGFNCSGCSGNLAIVEYGDRSGEALFTKDLTFSAEDDDSVYNIGSVTLDPEDTLDWEGKYIYQITVVDAAGSSEIPNKGVMLVTNNINPDFLEFWINGGYSTGYRLRLISDMTSTVSAYSSELVSKLLYIEE